MAELEWRSILLESAEQAYPFRAMTFPKFRQLLRAAGTSPAMLALGAVAPNTNDIEPYGLAMAYLHPDKRNAELMSLFVRKDLRHQGLGTWLTEGIESMIAARGYSLLSTIYMDRNPSIPYVQRILKRLEWTPPEVRFRVIRARISDILESPIAARFYRVGERRLNDIEVAPWASLTGRERAKLKVAVQTQGWAPDDLDPFSFEGQGLDGAEPEPSASFVCKRDGTVIGWHLVHRINAKTLRFSCSFIRPFARSPLAMFHVWDHALRDGQRNGYEFISWAVPPHHADMSGFSDRVLAPVATHDNHTFGTHKHLPLAH